MSNHERPLDRRLGLVVATAVPVFIVSTRAVFRPLGHPRSDLWLLVAGSVVFAVRRLLHRGPARPLERLWHLYFAGLASTAAISGALGLAAAHGSLDRSLALTAAASGGWVLLAELDHLRSAVEPLHRL